MYNSFFKDYFRYEDAGFVFRLNHPETMEKLRTVCCRFLPNEVSSMNTTNFQGTVFDLTPSERLEMMKVVIHQLLSYNKVTAVLQGAPEFKQKYESAPSSHANLDRRLYAT